MAKARTSRKKTVPPRRLDPAKIRQTLSPSPDQHPVQRFDKVFRSRSSHSFDLSSPCPLFSRMFFLLWYSFPSPLRRRLFRRGRLSISLVSSSTQKPYHSFSIEIDHLRGFLFCRRPCKQYSPRRRASSHPKPFSSRCRLESFVLAFFLVALAFSLILSSRCVRSLLCFFDVSLVVGIDRRGEHPRGEVREDL